MTYKCYTVSFSILILSFLCPNLNLSGQYREFEESGRFGPVIGIHAGESISVEGGVGMIVNFTEENEAYIVTAMAASVETIFTENLVVAPRLTAWYTRGIFSVGLGGGYYIGEEKSRFALQPELGLGIWTYRITWRINIFFGREVEGANTTDFSLTAFLPI